MRMRGWRAPRTSARSIARPVKSLACTMRRARVPALAPQRVAAAAAVEVHAQRLQLAHALGRLAHHLRTTARIAQARRRRAACRARARGTSRRGSNTARSRPGRSWCSRPPRASWSAPAHGRARRLQRRSSGRRCRCPAPARRSRSSAPAPRLDTRRRRPPTPTPPRAPQRPSRPCPRPAHGVLGGEQQRGARLIGAAPLARDLAAREPVVIAVDRAARHSSPASRALRSTAGVAGRGQDPHPRARRPAARPRACARRVTR
jgi:hypothetical protein